LVAALLPDHEQPTRAALVEAVDPSLEESAGGVIVVVSTR
jgi:hypothetical protein